MIPNQVLVNKHFDLNLFMAIYCFTSFQSDELMTPPGPLDLG